MHPESSYCAEDVCYMELSFTFVVVVGYRKLQESRSFPLQSICWFNCMRALIILVVAEFYVWLLLVPRMFVIGAYSSSYNFGFFAVALRATIHETGHCVRFKQCCATRFYYCFQRVLSPLGSVFAAWADSTRSHAHTQIEDCMNALI